MRVGWGFDAHRFEAQGQVKLGGVVVDASRGIEATSDGDVVAHAVADALLAVAALGDLGTHFLPDDPRWEGADSMAILGEVVSKVERVEIAVEFVDVTIVAETLRIAPHREDIRRRLSSTLRLPIEAVSVKATSTDALGFLGRDEGIAAVAVVTGRDV